MWKHNGKHNGKEYGNTMEIGINFLNTFFNMIAEIRNLYTKGQIKDIGFVAPKFDLDALSIAVLKEEIKVIFEERSDIKVPISNKMITLQWNAKGQQNKIMSNIHHSKANETYWIAFDIDFPFGNFGFEGTSYHNHLSFLNGYAENVFNPNDTKFEKDELSKSKADKRFKLGSSVFLLLLSDLIDLTDYKHSMLFNGDSSAEISVKAKMDDYKMLGIIPQTYFKDVYKNGRKTKVECINTKNILTINNDAFMFGATFDTKDKLVFIDNKLSFNPSIIFDAELRKYVAEMLPIGDEFIEWKLDGYELITIYDEADLLPTDIIISDSYNFTKFVDEKEHFKYYINIFRQCGK